MNKKRVIIYGLGALGLTYAHLLKDKCDLKILADENRIEKYKNSRLLLNNEEIFLEYITPKENFEADFIIITTKFSGLDSAIANIKNFVAEKTKIISLMNGVSSENIISQVYGKTKVVKSYFIGGSAIREGFSVTKLEGGKIVIPKNQKELKDFFNKTGIDYSEAEDIDYSLWVKLGVNIVLNQLSAIYQKTVADLKSMDEYSVLATNLIDEVIIVAEKVGIKNLQNYKRDVFAGIDLVADDGKTSMLQDVLNKRKTEVEIFSGEIIRLAKNFNISTPYNEKVYNKIKLIEESYL